ncbi:hypothetical protein [Aliiglaciecola sp. LCG003]|uniref:hypothetical protein n=1 Tax=Aliiglaciecola sp. LCG003 TaxID=3053655 RepID=UPI0025743166|nr:hypothetical protein [Aliiglaciecola sp. LCG003]WJG09884.1 hypothetical protein QR722_02285 [Aliiglaciecola sp. LCG003]
MNKFPIAFLLVILGLMGCAETPPKNTELHLQGKWLVEANGEVMLDPQTSGLKAWRGKLVSVSDGSAHVSQRKKLHIIDPESASLQAQPLKMIMSDKVEKSCFADYLADAPDLEAIAVDPRDDRVFVLVTEDATRSSGMSQACHLRYKNSGSTDYPTVLIRLELQADNTVLMTDVRPIQFAESFAVGNFPNDGIEGLSFAPDGTLYLALEKDKKSNARIFSIKIDEQFWQTEEFAQVSDPQLEFPSISSGNHPINGMDYFAVEGHKGFLIAGARNDSQLWVIDLEKKIPTKVLPLQFLAPTGNDEPNCQKWEVMDNASLEGLAVSGNTIWTINDPWKLHYMDNVQCEANRAKYSKMAPLLFSLSADPAWFE